MSARIAIVFEPGERSAAEAARLRDFLMSVEADTTLAAADVPLAAERLRGTVATLEKSGCEVFIAVQSRGHVLSDFLEAFTLLPVVGCKAGGANSAERAAVHTLRILGLKYREDRQRLERLASSARQHLERTEGEMRHSTADAEVPQPTEQPVRTRTLPDTPAQPPPGPNDQTVQDMAWLEEISKNFHVRPALSHGNASRAPAFQPRPALDYAPAMREIVSAARDIATAYNSESVTTAHFLAAIIDTERSAARAVLLDAGLDLGVLSGYVATQFPPRLESPPGFFALEDQALNTLNVAKDIARARNRPCLTSVDLLEALALRTDAPVADALWSSGITAVDLHEALERSAGPDECEEWLAANKPPPEPERPAELDLGAAARMQQRLFRESPRSDSADTPQTPPAAHEPRGKRRAAARKAKASETAAPKPPERQPKSRKKTDSTPRSGEPNTLPAPGADKVRIVQCNPLQPAIEVMEDASDVILEGGIVAFPTDTVYGIGVDATNSQAIQRLYEAKQRPGEKAIPLLIHSTTLLRQVARSVPDDIEGLLDQFWPGPLTVVFERHPSRFPAISREPTIGIRIPNSYLTLALLSMVGRPVATTSANRSGNVEATSAQQVAHELGTAVDLVIDGGETPGQAVSTVLSVVSKPYRILRHGAIPQAEIEAVLGFPVEG